MIRVDVVIMAHAGGGEYSEHLATGYTPYRGCVWAAAKPDWSNYWSVIHVDTGYILRKAIKSADQAKVVVERMDKYWRGASWETVILHQSEIQSDLYYKRDEYRIRKVGDSYLFWNLERREWVDYSAATVWSREAKEATDPDNLPMTVGEWTIS